MSRPRNKLNRRWQLERKEGTRAPEKIWEKLSRWTGSSLAQVDGPFSFLGAGHPDLNTPLSPVVGLFLLQLQCRPPQALLPECGSAGREHQSHLQGEDIALKPGGMEAVGRRGRAQGWQPQASALSAVPCCSFNTRKTIR